MTSDKIWALHPDECTPQSTNEPIDKKGKKNKLVKKKGFGENESNYST